MLSHDKGFFSPLTSPVDIELDLIGKGSEDLQILFNGNIPDFILQRFAEKAAFNFNNAKLVFEKKGNNSRLSILDLSLQTPKLTINGDVQRYFIKGNDEPHYRLDLKADNIHIDEVRTNVLALLSDSKTARKVCSIVQSGRAKSATYSFDAPVSGFSDIKSMDLHVDVATADIDIPEVYLHLHNASGPIAIAGGIQGTFFFGDPQNKLLAWLIRLLLLGGGITLVVPTLFTDIIGTVVVVLAGLLQWRLSRTSTGSYKSSQGI